MAQLFIGLISGTSMDGVDAALVDLEDFPSLRATTNHPYEPELRRRLEALCAGTRHELRETALLDAELGRRFARAALDVLGQAGVARNEITAIGSHGQTVRHYPGQHPPTSVQIADPNVIVAETGITTVADFRRRDLAVGGQGAPLVPAFHAAVFRQTGLDRAVLNLGGIANLTILPGDPQQAVTGFDTGPGNVLMDRWAARHLKSPMDHAGQWAASGRVDEALLGRMLRDGYFNRPPPKSTGTDYFNLDWIEAVLKRHQKRVLKRDVQATLCELTATTVARAIARQAPHTRELLVCGGGVHNLSLMFRLQMLLPEVAVRSSEDFGIPPDWVEAVAFAWLAKQTLEGRPGNLPSVTGASQAVVLGGIYKI